MRTKRVTALLVSALVLGLGGCATVQEGPSVAVMPAVGKDFNQFQNDDAVCRAFASRSIGKNVDAVQTENVVRGAAIGTAVGVAAGALANGHDSVGQGAGAGLLLGTAMGAANAAGAGDEAQRRYDIAYEQCMYAKGNQLPSQSGTSATTYYRGGSGAAVTVYSPSTTVVSPPPGPASVPPPPPPGR